MTPKQHKNGNYVITAILKSETMGKLTNEIPGSRLLISSLPGSALRAHVESLDKPRDVNKRSQNFISKDTHLVISISHAVASECDITPSSYN